jgi:3-hydroxyacyl-CoA dehydrogenase
LSEYKFAVVGAGSIGVGWSIVFARAGYSVCVFDIKSEILDRFWVQINSKLKLLAENDLLQEDLEAISKRITTTTELSQALTGADYVQECGPEELQIKQNIYKKLEELSSPNAILASSSSALTTTQFASDLPTKHRCLVVHPGNPPYLLAIAEVVPASFTSNHCVEETFKILRSVEMAPILVSHEPKGFVFNRIQGAVLREAYSLVRDGVISPKDLDLIVTEGLGKRWSIIGPFATAALNVQGGIKAHAARMGQSYFEMGQSRGQNEPWSAELIEKVSKDIEIKLNNSDWLINVEKRDLALMKITKLLLEIIKP